MLNALRHHLMEPTLFAEFCEEFTREINQLRRDAGAVIASARAEIKKIDRDLDMLVNLLLRGGAADKINAKMLGLEARKRDLERDLALALDDADENKRVEAGEVIRSLIEAIVLTPEEDELKIDVRGDLAGILSIAFERKKTRLWGGFLEVCDLR